MPSGLIIPDGNSLTNGNGGQTTPWPTLAAAALNYGPGVTWTNIAVGGRVTPTMIANAPTAVDALYGSVPGPTNLVCAWELTNDIANGGAPVIHAFERMQRYCAERRAKGFKVLVGTMINRGSGNVFSGETLEAMRLAVNTLVRNSWTAFADGLVDIGADSVFGIDLGYQNTTYYQVDGIHPTAAGAIRIAGIWQSAIAAFVQ